MPKVGAPCAKAFCRAKPQDPNLIRNRAKMPTLTKMILDQPTGAPSHSAKMQKPDKRPRVAT